VPESEALSASPVPETLDRFFGEQLAPLMRERGDCLPAGVSVVFLLSGGGAWRVERDAAGEIHIEGWGDGRPGRDDCTVECAGEDFLAILEGRLHPARAFLSGRVRVEGDIGLVLRLQQCVLSEVA
jgi:hypothetical protein